MLMRRLLTALMALALLAPGVSALSETMPYHITVDCYNNIVTVYSTADGSVVRQMVCSAGTAKMPTPKGTFRMPEEHKWRERQDWYVFEDGYGKWATRIRGNYLFHSYLYTKMDDSFVDWETYAAMGTNASHGCVRLFIDDAKWITDHCFAGTKVKVYDGDTRLDYIKELLYERSYTADSGITYQEYASLAADASELGFGSNGSAVVRLQERMIELGLYAGDADGIYGAAMVRAVKAIQSALGLKVTGVVNEGFAQLLAGEDAPCSNISTLKEGMGGPAVEALQATLASLGLYEGAPDGVYEADTREAVVLFERARGFGETGVATGALQRDMLQALDKLAEMFGEGGYALTFEDRIVESAVIDTEHKLNVRSAKSTDSSIVARLEPGTAVSVIDHGGSWTKIAFGGEEGYARTGYLAFSQTTIRTPRYVPADAEHPALARVEAGRTMIASKKVAYGLVDTEDRLFVRESHSDSAKLSFMLSPKTVVRVLSVSKSWAFISYGGRTGFAKLAYLSTRDVMELSGAAARDASAGQAQARDEALYAYAAEGATLYSAASESGEALLELAAGERAQVIFESTSWTQVRAGGVTGYVSNDLVFVGTDAAIDEYIVQLEASKTVYAVVSTGSDALLNMRAGASEDAQITQTLENGTIVEVKANDGAWCEIEYDWRTGYVMSRYVLEIDESGEPYDPDKAGYEAYEFDEVTDEALTDEGG